MRIINEGMPVTETPDAAALAATLAAQADAHLAAADAALTAGYPGDTPARQPVHTVYVSADRYRSDLVPTWGGAALAAVDEQAGVFAELAGSDELVARVRDKLGVEPIEDLRLDFEDGYGDRGDDVEDADVLAAADALAEAERAGTAAPYRGIRFKSLEAPTRHRGCAP